MLAIETARFHGAADSRIERAVGVARHFERESHGFEQQRAHRHGLTGVRRDLHQLTLWIESLARGFNRAEPRERALDARITVGVRTALHACVADDVDRDERAHEHVRPPRGTTWPWRALR